MAFWAFLALIPALAAFVSILGLVTSPDEAAQRAEDLFGALPSAAQDLLTEQLETIAGTTGSSPQWKWVSWGAVVAVLLWVVASVAFRTYTANFASYNETYGSLAAVVVLMLWLLITALSVLLGAQVNSETEHQTVADSTVEPDRPIGERDAVVADTVGASADSPGDDTPTA